MAQRFLALLAATATWRIEPDGALVLRMRDDIKLRFRKDAKTFLDRLGSPA